jgi:hypothetical protein
MLAHRLALAKRTARPTLWLKHAGQRLVVLGERQSGRLLIGVLRADGGGIDWERFSTSAPRIHAPKSWSWSGAGDVRVIADLYLDPEGTGTEDEGYPGVWRPLPAR